MSPTKMDTLTASLAALRQRPHVPPGPSREDELLIAADKRNLEAAEKEFTDALGNPSRGISLSPVSLAPPGGGSRQKLLGATGISSAASKSKPTP
jgi:hypothetical protein